MKCRVTRIGAYLYRRRYTLSVSWRIRWHWLPFVERLGFQGSWMVGWGWFAIEKSCWDWNDDWGERSAELTVDILTQLMTGDGPLMDMDETEAVT